MFNMIKNKIEAKPLVKHISWDRKFKFSSTNSKSNQTRNNETWQCECKNYRKCKKIIVGILVNVFVRMVSI